MDHCIAAACPIENVKELGKANRVLIRQKLSALTKKSAEILLNTGQSAFAAVQELLNTLSYEKGNPGDRPLLHQLQLLQF
ncbi:hypothetical protein [Leptolyngbya sp. FACHB-671]|uniref:hypothetical protein n=1 Tax=Leptolyngbya sp. FACHB-671 TaxID=2692812 RepID=UPI001A7EB630|nr:hypothetical protein [Leptolyngbya sp. FACHB-671]